MFTFSQRAAMVLMSAVAPHRVARLMLQVPAQPMKGDMTVDAQRERIAFQSGGVLCRGWWLRRKRSGVCVVVAHGWSSHPLRMIPFVERLLDLGYEVMVYSARSHGDSDRFPVCSVAQFAEDVDAAVRYARERVDRVAVVAHSMGAAGTIVAAADGAPMEAAVALAPPAHPARSTMDYLRAKGAPADLIFRRAGSLVESLIGRSYDSAAPEVRIPEVTIPLLLVHGTDDQTVPVSDFHAIAARAGANVERVLHEGEGHDLITAAPKTFGDVAEFLGRKFPL